MRMRTLVLAAVVAGCVASAVARQETVREIHKVYPIVADGRVMIDTYKGSIRVATWDRAEVEVSVSIEPGGGGRADEENVTLTDIDIRSNAKELRLETDYRRVRSKRSFLGISWNEGNLPLVHYSLTMPTTAQLEIKDYKSESSIEGLSADLRFETYKGTLKAQDLAGAVVLETYKGEVDIELSELREDCRFETYKGTIRIQVPKSTGFDLNAEIGRHGDLSSDFDLALAQNRDDEGEYRGPVNGGGPEIRLESHKGSFRLRAR